MKNRLTGITDSQGFKAGTLIILTLIMLIPISMVNSLIRERAYRAEEVKSDISSAAGGELRFSGPAVRIPGIRRIEKTYINNEGRKTSEFYNEDFSLWYSAEDLNVEIILDTENKYRGIFYSPVFTGTVEMSGEFNFAGIYDGLEENEELFVDDAEIVVPFVNQKAIRRISSADWMGSEISLQSGSRSIPIEGGGMYGKINISEDIIRQEEKSEFSFNILVRGAGSVSVLPLAGSASMNIKADWPAPSFRGLCLPDSHDISDEEFCADWDCSSLSSGLPVKWADSDFIDGFSLSGCYIETDFLNIMDHYKLNERAAKYAILFIMLPFITLFMFEQFFKIRLHIIHYILSGIANIIFYLLLLSLSEHISFNLSYLIAAAAVTLLVCLYSWSILKKEGRAWYMAPVMAGVYIFLFITLQSEDWALLIGSIGVFAITALLMFITRKIDFFRNRQAGE